MDPRVVAPHPPVGFEETDTLMTVNLAYEIK
jgi:hypothetical protein